MTRTSLSIARLTLMSALLLSATAQAGALLSNGGFETGALSGEYCYVSGYVNTCPNALNGWNTQNNVISISANSNAWGNPSTALGGAAQAQLGTRIVGLQMNSAQLSQTLTLNAGIYALSWFDAGRNAFFGETLNYEVLLSGAVLNRYAVNLGQAWSQHQQTFTLSTNQTVDLSFLNSATANNLDRTVFLDNVSLEKIGNVPEPASAWLVLACLGSVGWAARRRRG